MLRIKNISKGRPNQAHVAMRTNWGAGTAAFPILLDLAPGAQVDVPAQSANNWDPGVKQFLAEYVSYGILKVFTLVSKHDYEDKNHNAIYGYDYLIDAKFGPLAEAHALAMATTLNTEVLPNRQMKLSNAGGTVGSCAW